VIPRRRLERRASGGFRLRLQRRERELLAALAAELDGRLAQVARETGPDEIRPLHPSASGEGGPDEDRPRAGDARPLQQPAAPAKGGTGDDLVRLFPPAYGEDPEDEREYRRLTRVELLDGKREALRVFAATLEREELTAEELEVWLRVLNDLRLVLGTRLDVSEETYGRPFDPRDPDAHELAVYGYLSWLQEQAVEAASAGLGRR
jgi:hypothetical protein